MNKTRLAIELTITKAHFLIVFKGFTDIGQALRFVRTSVFTVEAGDRPNVPNVVMLFTDGVSTINNDQVMTEV